MNDIVTQIRDRARTNGGHVVLSEGADERMTTAAEMLVAEGICEVTLIGSEVEIARSVGSSGANLAGVKCLDPATHPDNLIWGEQLHELRKHRGMTEEDARVFALDPLVAAALMVRRGDATATVGGAMHATGDVVRAALWCIGTAEGVSVVSGGFVMVVPNYLASGQDKVLYFADGGVVPDPDAKQLASIAVASAETFESLTGEQARVAMISFSTKGSASHADVDKVVEATAIAKDTRPALSIDGELQVDAAIVPDVAARKAPESEVAGNANVLIFPDLGAGNSAYKLVQRLAGATALGPILQGLARPAHDLSRGCSAEDIVDMAAIAICMG